MSASISKSRPVGRDISLDILRGVAILLVIAAHWKHPAAPGSITGWLAQNVFSAGGVGVDLFFVLSGFLIGGLLINEYNKYGRLHVWRFLVRRGFKIYPLYYIFMAYLFLMPAAKALFGGENVRDVIVSHWKLLWPNLIFLNNYLGSDPEGHTWSLAVEEHFYIFLPFLLLVLIKWQRVSWIVWVGAALMIGCCFLRWEHFGLGVHADTMWTESHVRIDSLFLGVVLRYWESRRVKITKSEEFTKADSLAGLAMIVAGIGCWCVVFGFDWSGRLDLSVGFTVRTVGAGLILYGTWMNRFHLSRVSRSLVGRPLMWLAGVGAYSYGIYVWHITAMRGVERYAGARIHGIFGISETSWIIEAFIYSTAALALGMFMTRLVEQPCLRLRDRLFPSHIHAVSGVAGNTEKASDVKLVCDHEAAHTIS
jgi:peptidoglycan/LPS O-acetylase OafA/YrhL